MAKEYTEEQIIRLAAAESRVMVYTDGSHSPRHRVGGWAWVVLGRKRDSGWEDNSTITRMELRAALEAITSFEEKLLVVTDYDTLADCFNLGFWQDWEKHNWFEGTEDAIKEPELWQALVQEFKIRNRQAGIKFVWVSRSAGIPGNVAADEEAKQARKQREQMLDEG